MHNKMEIEGAASDAARPQAADFPCEAGRMRRLDGQICSLSGKNAAETARTRRVIHLGITGVGIWFLSASHFDGHRYQQPSMGGTD